jgi:hypothetical protein
LNGFAAHVIASGTGKTYMSYIPDRKIMELSRQINEAREKFEKVAAERDALRDDLAAARALLKSQPPADSRPCHECGAIWWSDEHGCWFVGGHRNRIDALAWKDAPKS